LPFGPVWVRACPCELVGKDETNGWASERTQVFGALRVGNLVGRVIA